MPKSMYIKKAKDIKKKQTLKDRLDEAEGKKKGVKKNTQTTKDRLDEAEPKKKKAEPKKAKK